MNGQYAYTPQIWPSFLTVLLLIILSVYSGHRRRVPGASQFMFACLFATAWAASSVTEYAAVDLATKIFWVKFQAVWQLPLVTGVSCFFLEYAWPGRWLSRRNVVLLSIAPLLFLASALTNDLHHSIWRSFGFDGSVIPVLGPAGWTALVYGYGLGILNLLALVRLFRFSSQQRWPAVALLMGLIGGHVLYLLERANLLGSVLPIDLLAMAFEFLMYATALFRFQILDPIPLARQTVIEQLHAGMLVLDSQGRIVDLNPAAGAMLGAPAKHLLRRPIRDVLPAGASAGGDFPAAGAGQGEISLGIGPEARYYQLEGSPLNDWRGREIGRLLLLQDVTEQKRAQAQLLEQQRALAMLHEREQLARELHDSIGQVLGFASLKLEAARKLIADRKLAKADDQLVHLASVITETHADVREHILDLRTVPAGEEPFFSSLQHYLDGFRQNYEIHVDVGIGAGIDDNDLAPEARVQLFRILQEALSNARKHAGAKEVQISFEREGTLLRMRISDNGKGFDPLQAAGAGGGHFGLRIMRERAEQLGGTLRVQSAPGKGTRVEVDVPIDEKVVMV